MKSYTDFEQSKILKDILPFGSEDGALTENYHCIPCWSLATLLEIIRNNGRYELQMYEGGYYLKANEFMTESYVYAIDACYEMVLKLHELKLL